MASSKQTVPGLTRLREVVTGFMSRLRSGFVPYLQLVLAALPFQRHALAGLKTDSGRSWSHLEPIGKPANPLAAVDTRLMPSRANS